MWNFPWIIFKSPTSLNSEIEKDTKCGRKKIMNPKNFIEFFFENTINNNPIAEQVVVRSHSKLCSLRGSDISPGNFGAIAIEGISEKIINPAIINSWLEQIIETVCKTF